MTKVLIIEDDNRIRANIAEILAYEGYETFEAENGQVGVQVAQQIIPDIIICDVMMPELDGYGVLLQLRSERSTQNIPFIFLTARVDRPDIRYGMELGADDYLTKPFLPNELLRAIQARLEKHAKLTEEHAGKMDELRDHLLTTLPHELRTPLTGILGYAQMLVMSSETMSPAKISKMAEMIDKAGQRLHRLIENYLLYAQIEIIQSDPKRLNALRSYSIDNPADIIENSARQKAYSEDRDKDLTVSVQDAHVQITANDLQKIVMELVDNAFKFSEPGTAVEVEAAPDGNDYMLRVSDHGRGMTPEQIQQVGVYMQFERKLYEQQGLGLGLINAKRIAELHGGKLKIESTYGQRTTVHIRLPLA